MEAVRPAIIPPPSCPLRHVPPSCPSILSLCHAPSVMPLHHAPPLQHSLDPRYVCVLPDAGDWFLARMTTPLREISPHPPVFPNMAFCVGSRIIWLKLSLAKRRTTNVLILFFKDLPCCHLFYFLRSWQLHLQKVRVLSRPALGDGRVCVLMFYSNTYWHCLWVSHWLRSQIPVRENRYSWSTLLMVGHGAFICYEWTLFYSVL